MLGDDTFSIETAYTSLTRGRSRNQLYLAHPEPDVDCHSHRVVADLITAFTDAIARSEAKVSAIDQMLDDELANMRPSRASSDGVEIDF